MKQKLAIVAIVSILLAVGASGVVAQTSPDSSGVTVYSSDTTIQETGNTGESVITIDADNGISTANVTVSINTTVAEIVSVNQGADVDSSDPAVTFSTDQSTGTVNIEYNNIGASADPTTGFELAVVELESQINQGTSRINLDGQAFDGDNNQYGTVHVQEGTVDVGSEPAQFLVSDVSPEDATVSKGEDLGISANVTNVGGSDGQAQVQLVLNDTIQDSVLTSSLSPDESDQVDLTLSTSNLDAGEYIYSVTTGDDELFGNITIEEGSPGATLVSGSATAQANGDVEQSSITIDAENGVGIANVELSIDTSVAEVMSVQPGSDVDTSQSSVTFDVKNQAPGSARIEYANIGADTEQVSGFEIATVQLEAQTDDGEATIEVVEDGIYDGESSRYSLVSRDQGLFSVGSLFAQPLPGFEGQNPPTNTGELDPTLYEDVNGDGDGLSPSQSVEWWSQLVQKPGDFDDLTQEQVDSLDWSGDGELSPEDAVKLWSEQVQAGS